MEYLENLSYYESFIYIGARVRVIECDANDSLTSPHIGKLGTVLEDEFIVGAPDVLLDDGQTVVFDCTELEPYKVDINKIMSLLNILEKRYENN